jgi:hypothetical protein
MPEHWLIGCRMGVIILVSYSITPVIKNKKNLNHRAHRVHRGEKRFSFLCVLCALCGERMWFFDWGQNPP